MSTTLEFRECIRIDNIIVLGEGSEQEVEEIHKEKHAYLSYFFRAGKQFKVQFFGYIVWKREKEEEITEKFKYNSVYSLTTSLCNTQSLPRRSTISPEVPLY
jgi:hypothetical protein